MVKSHPQKAVCSSEKSVLAISISSVIQVVLMIVNRILL